MTPAIPSPRALTKEKLAAVLADLAALAKEFRTFDGAVLSNERFGEGFLTGLTHAANSIDAALAQAIDAAGDKGREDCGVCEQRRATGYVAACASCLPTLGATAAPAPREAAEREALAEAWDAGYARCVLDRAEEVMGDPCGPSRNPHDTSAETVEREALAWPYGTDAACRLIAAAGNPNERVENRDGWAVTMPHRPDVFTIETERARQRLEQAIAHVRALLPTPHEGDSAEVGTDG